MKQIENFIIDGIDYGKVLKAFEKFQGFPTSGDYEEYFSFIIDALKKSSPEITEASKVISQLRISGDFYYPDKPTDIIWIMSIILTMRTLGILESKARDGDRDQKNRDIHRSLKNNYLNLLAKLIEEKNKYVALFPYKDMEND